MLLMAQWRNDFDERYPIYKQIVNRFTRSLVRQELKPGERVPSIRDVALTLGVNTNTVQRAYQELERGELIFPQGGTGYYVSQDEKVIERIELEVVHESVVKFLEEMRELGLDNVRILAELKKQMETEEKGDAADEGCRA